MMTATVIATPGTESSYGASEVASRGHCALCRTALGRIINRGAPCRICEQRVCKSCREYVRHSATEWLCSTCHKSRDMNSKFWLTEFVERTSNKLQCSIKNSLQRSLTFSESSPSPWAAVRGSPELRAYSSMPRHHDIPTRALQSCADNTRQFEDKAQQSSEESERPRPFPRRGQKSGAVRVMSNEETVRSEGGVHGDQTDTRTDRTEFKVVDTCGTVLDLPSLPHSAEGDSHSHQCSPPPRHSHTTAPVSPSAAKALISVRRKMVDLKQLPPGVTPPRSRRLFVTGRRLEDPQLTPEPGSCPYYDPGTGRVFISDGEDYKLVFLSGSDSSSREEIHSDDASSTCSGAMGFMDEADWDYFENSSKTIPVLTNFEDFHSSRSRTQTQKSILVPIERESEVHSISEESRSLGGEGEACLVVGEPDTRSNSANTGTSLSASSYLANYGSCVPLPIPVPIPVPIFVPVPCNNPELTIRIEHYLSPGFWSNFLASNGQSSNLNNFYSNLSNQLPSSSNHLSGNNDILYNYSSGSNVGNEPTASNSISPPRAMETSRVNNTKITNVTSESEPMKTKSIQDVPKESGVKCELTNVTSDSDSMLVKTTGIKDTSKESHAVTLKTYKKFDEDGKDSIRQDVSVHPDDGNFDSMSDSSESSSASKSPVRRKYRFNNTDEEESDILGSSSEESNSSDEEEDKDVVDNHADDVKSKDKFIINKQPSGRSKNDISLSAILNFDSNLHSDVKDLEDDKPHQTGLIETNAKCDLKLESQISNDPTPCDNSNVSSNKANVTDRSKLDVTDPNGDVRSSDEFSGTESMELVPLYEEQGHVGLGSSESCNTSGPFTSLVMITDDIVTAEPGNEGERNSPVHVNVVTTDTTTFVPSKDREKFKLTLNTSQASEEKTKSDANENTAKLISHADAEEQSSSTVDNAPQEQVRVVTGGNTLSAVVCLEEGLADDDSWVEELDREEMPITDSSEGEQDFPDREEELRGYHRTAIDYSLFTIVEESCEESEVENEKSLPTQLENYFLKGIGGGDTISLKIDDTVSETSSIFSEDVESADNLEQDDVTKPYVSELGTSRLEQYFLTEFMGFRRRDSDGSVGSDSEGRPSPEQRRKRLVRARGTGRHYSSSLDNLTESEQQVEMQLESENSSSETDSRDESSSFEKNDGQFDTVKRTKKKKRSVTSAPSLEMLDVPEEHELNDDNPHREEVVNSENETDDHEMELIAQSDRNKQQSQSRDSGFMGSSDDLIKETKTVEPGEETLTEEIEEEVEVVAPESKPAPVEVHEVEESTSAKLVDEPQVRAPPQTALSRKDSFNNWSSDEETNLMMSKMKAFFKTMVANQPKPSSPTVVKPKPIHKPPQLIYFENELTRLMKTVPGIREDQVREIVEYLSSEDTWSDSYDSSDYTSSDLDIKCKKHGTGLSLEQSRDSALVYQRLLASFQKVDTVSSDSSTSQNSPPLIAKVMQHIGSRLVALMHEVSSGEGGAPSPRMSRYHRRVQPKLSNISTTTEEDEDVMEEFPSPLPRSKSHDPLLEEARQEASDNERFSWRGSFESALMVSDSRGRLASGGDMSTSASALAIANAKRRSAGDLLFKSPSREQLDRVRSCGSIGGSVEDKIWGLRGKRRRSSVPDDSGANSGGSADGEEDSEDEVEIGKSTTLPRSLQTSCAAGTNSLPRLPTSGASPSIYKAHSAHHVNAKSARYRPPGYSSRSSGVAAPPRRGENRRRTQLTPPPIAAHLSSPKLGVPDELGGLCSDSPINKSASTSILDDDVSDRLSLSNPNKSSLGARSDSMASVYSGAGEGRYGSVTVKGEVEFGLQYNYKQGALEIHVKGCKDLAPVDTKRMRSDPYVKVYLLPDKSKAGKRKTRVKKHTLCPAFEEVLKFHLTLEDLESRTLWLSVWHSDMFGRNDFLGEVLIPLENKVFDDPSPKAYTLQERSEVLDELICSKGELIIGLKFVPSEDCNKKSSLMSAKGSLHVLIKEAKNLCPIKSNSTLDAFCKAYLLPEKGKGSKHKTGIVKRNTSPHWNHTVVYRDVSLDELSERCLELTVWDHDRLTSNEFLGGVRLNLGHGKHYSKLVDWMDSSGKEILLWQQMMERPNFWVESCVPLRNSLDLRNT
uniref:Synaptotagmin-like protein 5 n=1 Tax=Cacopsylla melanoneura TaxID=428564 RepID=A0A8D8X929_9HEMI